MNRNLDGVFFRVKRDNKWQSICWSDLTEQEMDWVLSEQTETFAKNLCKILGKRIHEIGEELDLIGEG